MTATMPQFELGGSVKTSINNELTTVFTSSFAKEMAKETSSIQNDSLYKSDFATSLLETSQHAPTPETQAAMEDVAENIYENFSADSNIYENVRQGLDSFDFGRPSQVKLYLFCQSRLSKSLVFQIFNSTMLAGYQSSPRESLSSISRYENFVKRFLKNLNSLSYSGCKQLLQLMAIAMRLKASTSLRITVSMATPRLTLSVVTSMLITIL